MTPFSLLVARAGLSWAETEAFLLASRETVRSWTNGRRTPHPENILKLKTLILRQKLAAEECLALVTEAFEEAMATGTPLDFVTLGYPADDHEAQALGLPCVGAWRAMAARVVEQSPVPVRLVPRGADLATAGALEAHRK